MSVSSSPSDTDMEASRRAPRFEAAPTLHLETDEARRQPIAHFDQIGGPLRILKHERLHVPFVQPQFFSWDRRRAVERRQGGAGLRINQPHVAHEPGLARAGRPRRVALGVRAPVLIADRLAVHLEADERARQLRVELGRKLRGSGPERALHALAFGGTQLAEPLVLHVGQRRHEQHHDTHEDRDRRYATLSERHGSESSMGEKAINPAKSRI
jgi:hypothetical protein